MLEKKNKGGLKMTKEYLFLMNRAMEQVVNTQEATNSAIKQSLDKNVLKETLMEDFMVKFYIEKLCKTNETIEEDDEHVVSGLLEDICQLFLTIRGFTMVKLKRNKLCNNEKTGNRFRAVLKQKCSNTKA